MNMINSKLSVFVAAVAAAMCVRADLSEFPEGKDGAIAFTFDDGTVDQYEVAAPVLDKYGIKAIFNIIPSRVGTDDAKYMTWDQIRDLVRRGHALGNHTMTHPNLNKVASEKGKEAVRAEIMDAYNLIKEKTGYEPKVLCYPYNASGPVSGEIVKEEGLENIAYRMDNWGGNFGAEAAHKAAEKILADHATRFVLIHGLRPGGGWAPFNKPEQFEEVVKALLSHTNLWVGGYTELIDRRKAVQAEKQRRKWENEQLGRYAPHAFAVEVVGKGGWTAVRKCGEEVEFRYSFRPASSNVLPLVKGLKAKVTLDNFGSRKLFEDEVDFDPSVTNTVKGTLAEPGFLRLTIDVPGLTPNFGGAWQRSVAFEPERLVKVGECPSDFDTFWSERLAAAEKIPLDAKCELVEKKSQKEWNTYAVSFATTNDRRVYGYLMVPKTASKESPVSLRVQVPGAGVGGWSLWPHAPKGEALLFMTVFPWAPSDDTGWQNARYREMVADFEKRFTYHHYFTAGLSESPAEAFFTPVILGVSRAVDWAASREEIDASRVTYYGISQGGGFGLYLGALNRTISRLVVNVPAFSDMLCDQAGRQTCTAKNLYNYDDSAVADAARRNEGYLDTANFAARITKPILFVTGVSDWVCPPATVYVAYNRCPSPEKAIRLNGGDHGSAPGEAEGEANRFLGGSR